jgi:phage N-6-adenine-methyltransferase
VPSAARVMPSQKPGRSKQDYHTPRPFLDAVERRFGTIVWDLAANSENHVCCNWYGPGSESAEDSLDPALRWRRSGLSWLNPPFGNIEPWASKCADEVPSWNPVKTERIALLVPASVGSSWFNEHVFNKALILFFRPRLSFDRVAPFPKDCMLCIYGMSPIIETWNWHADR